MPNMVTGAHAGGRRQLPMRTRCAARSTHFCRLMKTSRQMCLASLVAIFLCGCVSHRDIMPSSQYPTDYVFGGTYRFKQDLVADAVDSPLFSHYKTFMPLAMANYYPSPLDIKTHPQDFSPSHVLVQSGTRIRIEQFDLERNPEAGPTVWIQTRVLDGPLAGNRLCVSLISREAGYSRLKVRLLMVDTNYLERVDNP